MAKARPMLVIGPNLKLPEEAVTETFAILGKRGVGKTTTARVLTEELLAVGLPALILDPTGVWWGLRTSADGAGDGSRSSSSAAITRTFRSRRPPAR